tara:strand:+ start:994 stop:1659 length:666 start_codon:yes stop_codon:yes gene_type:complete
MSGLTHQPIQRDDLKGLFVVLEGLDGSGKTTQAIRLYNRLKRRGVPTSLFREPGSTDLGEKVRRILKSGTVDHPITELLLFNSARSSLVSQKISPALANGQVVICDRFASSTIAYQGYGSGINLERIKQINNYATMDLKPDLTILIDLDPKISLLRLKKYRTSQDHYEQNDFSFHRRVREGYLALAKENTNTWKILDGTLDPKTLAIAVWEEMSALIRRIN